MKKLLRLLTLIISALPAIAQEQQPSPEFGPHWKGDKFLFVGEFHKNYVYLMINTADKSDATVKNNITANVYIMREDIQILFRDPKSGKFTVLDMSDPANSNMKASDLKFHEAPAQSNAALAWLRATKPKDYPENLKKGKQREWILVGTTAAEKGLNAYYVGTKIMNQKPELDFDFVPFLVLNQQQMTFYFDKKNQTVAAVNTDVFWSASEKLKYRKLTPGGVDDAILKAVESKNK